MKKLLVFLAIGMLLFSCKKEDINFTLTGTITDATFGSGLQGATLTLKQIPIGGGTQQVIGSTTLGANGSYSFTFPREKVSKYILTVTKNNYFSIYKEITFSEFSPEEDLVKNYSTTAMAWVKIRIVNSAPASVTDSFRFNKQEGKNDCPECCPQVEHLLTGLVDTTFICPTDANTPFSIFYQVPNTTIQGIESIQSVAFDTVTIQKSF